MLFQQVPGLEVRQHQASPNKHADIYVCVPILRYRIKSCIKALDTIGYYSKKLLASKLTYKQWRAVDM